MERTPQDYADHVQEMLDAYGVFDITVDELIAEDDRVYARWTQAGHHLWPVDGYQPTGVPMPLSPTNVLMATPRHSPVCSSTVSGCR